MLLTAEIKDREVGKNILHRGCVLTNYERLSEALGMTYAQARRAVENLRSTGELTTFQRGRFVEISIPRYDDYQGDNATKTQPKRNQNATDHYKNIKKEKKDIYIRPLNDYGGVYLSDDDFDELKGMVRDAGEFLNVIDRAGEWLKDNPRPVEKHKTIVKTFLRNDGLI